MKIKLTFLLAALLITANLVAKPIPKDRAELLAKDFFAKRGANASMRAKANMTYKLCYVGKSDKNREHFFIYNIGDNAGFVIMAADSRARTVLAYSNTGSFQPENIPVNLKEWLSGYSSQIDYAVNNLPDVDVQPIQNAPSATVIVAPILGAIEYDQSAPYNDSCPKIGTTNTYTGCVATAMAQVMRYYQYPTKGAGSYSYVWNTTTTLSANFGNTTYDWANMLTKYTASTTPAPTAAQKAAIARLMYHAGVSVEMDYGIGTDGSAAVSNRIPNALFTYFTYDAGIQSYSTDYFSSDFWITKLKAELNAKRPVIYTGSAANGTGGHAFVCDGYDDGNFFHMNWGWSGSSNGYYALNALIPAGTTYNFSYHNEMITGIQKQQVGSKHLVYLGMDSLTTTKASYQRTENVFDIIKSIYLIDGFPYNKGFTLKLVNPTDSTIVREKNPGLLSPGYAYDVSESYGYAIPSTVKEGFYKLRAYYKNENGAVVPFLPSKNGFNYINVEITSSNVIFSQPTAKPILLQTTTKPVATTALHPNFQGTINASIANTGLNNYTGSLILKLTNASDATKTQSIQVDNQQITVNTTKTISFTGNITVPVGTYNVQVFYKAGTDATPATLAGSYASAIIVSDLSTPNTSGVVFVKKGGTGTKTGVDWNNAVGELADALLAAQTNTAIKQIWVAKGTYLPMYSPADGKFGTADGRNNAFFLVKNVQIYGGFAGNETTLQDRNWSANPTILSGDFNGDDVFTVTDNAPALTNDGENAYHVIVSVNDVGTAILDGFTVRGGNGTTITNIKVGGADVSQEKGAAIFTLNSSPKIQNCIFLGNRANYGGALEINSNVQIMNCVFRGNISNYGGAIHGTTSTITIVNCTFVAQAAGVGGTINSNNCTVNLYNTIAIKNQSFLYDGTGTTITNAKYSLIQGSLDATNGNIPNDKYYYTDLFTDINTGDYTLKNGSPCINKGSNALYTGNPATDKDLGVNTRVVFGTIDIGAYEKQITPNVDGILYVKKGSSGLGSSWADALGEVADALAAAKTNVNVHQIWVAAGTYNPKYSPADDKFGIFDDRNNSFMLVKDVKVYGGFAGGETSIDARNWKKNPTILSGDFKGDDVFTVINNGSTLTNDGENAYHVIVSVGDVGTAVLDGFTVRGGNGTATGNIIVGGYTIQQYAGGGIKNWYSSPQITNCIFLSNRANYGGAIENFHYNGQISNSLFLGNISNYGGGIINTESTNTLVNCTFVSNSAGYGGALNIGTNATVNINNCIIMGNSSSYVLATGTAVPIVKNSLIQGSSDATNGNIPAGTYTTANIFTNPLSDFTLKTGSPCINKGSNALYTGALFTNYDLGMNLRIVFGTIDMGAYEKQPTPDANGIVYVKKGSNGTGSSWTDAVGEVAEALVAAKTNVNIHQIWVTAGTYKPQFSPADNLFGISDGRNNSFLMVKDVKMYGGFAGGETVLTARDWQKNPTVLSGDVNSDDSFTITNNAPTLTNDVENNYHVLVSAGDVGTAVLDGFTIKGGNATTTGSTITVNGYILQKYAGGGIKNWESSPQISNCKFIGNRGNYGGAIENYKYIGKIVNSLFLGNVSNFGGGMINTGSTPTVVNCTFAANYAGTGGAMKNASSTVNVYNTIVMGNNNGLNNDADVTMNIKNSLVQGMAADPANFVLDGGLTPSDVYDNPTAPDYNYVLKQTSPCINTGSNSLYITGGVIPATDKDIIGKPRLDGTTIDMGAYEFVASTGIFETKADALSFYPNPAKDVIHLDGVSENADITVLDMAGRILIRTELNQNTIDVSALKPGIYVIKVSDTYGLKTGKFTKK